VIIPFQSLKDRDLKIMTVGSEGFVDIGVEEGKLFVVSAVSIFMCGGRSIG
jgi:hypothetical protein